MKVFYCRSDTVFCADSESAFEKSKIDCLRVAVDVKSSKIDFFPGQQMKDFYCRSGTDFCADSESAFEDPKSTV